MPTTVLSDALAWDEGHDLATLLVAGIPVLGLRRGDGRARSGLLLPPVGERFVDVSAQPGALAAALSASLGVDGRPWHGAVAAAAAATAQRWELWPAPPSWADDLVQVAGALAHPMLVGPYDAGAWPIGELPRWAAPALTEATAREAARRLFGPTATHAVTRSLGSFLCRPMVRWWALGLAVAAAPLVQPDHLCRYLEADPVDAEGFPANEDVRSIRAGLLVLADPAVAHRLLLDAVATADAPRRLARSLTLAARVLADAPHARLRGLDDLERLCLQLTPIDPSPPGTPAVGPLPARRRRSPPPAPASATGHLPGRVPIAPTPPTLVPEPTRLRPPAYLQPRAAPVTRSRAPAPRLQLQHGPLTRALEGHLPGEVELVAPRTASELDMWGQLLQSCIGSFAAAVADGTTIVLGVRHRGRLVAALEVRSGRLQQLLGPRNHHPSLAVRRVVLPHVERVLTMTGAASSARRRTGT